MLKNIFALGAVFALLMAPTMGSVALAAEDSVSIGSVPSTCTGADFDFTGRATYSEKTQHFVVTLDGTEVYSSTSEPESWSTGNIAVSSPGPHTLVATIYDKSNRETVMASDSVTFCDSSGDSSGGGDGSGDQGPGGDCCPGPDPVVEEETLTTPKVAGATTADVWARLRPLNSIFRLVFDRNPTFEEWTYWGNRLLDDNMAYDELYGAMQWHELDGRTVGD